MPAALWIGEIKSLYFRDAFDALRRRGPVLTVDALSSEAAASEIARPSGPAAETNDVDLIVVAEGFPGEFLPSRFDELRSRFPTLPIVRLCGPWCEGELRSRVPPPSWRLPWYRAATEFAQEDARIARDECPSWGRPVTETEEERLATGPVLPPERSPAQRVGVWSARPANAAWLLDAVRALGSTPVRLDEPRSVDAADIDVLLWDFVVLPEASAVPAAVANPQNRRGVALVDFLRREQSDFLQDRGFTTVLVKPCRLEDLAWAIRKS